MPGILPETNILIVHKRSPRKSTELCNWSMYDQSLNSLISSFLILDSSLWTQLLDSLSSMNTFHDCSRFPWHQKDFHIDHITILLLHQDSRFSKGNFSTNRAECQEFYRKQTEWLLTKDSQKNQQNYATEAFMTNP